ncbi:MAG: hypothetical protein ACFFAD_12235 [Candidatus Hermodarchaeota archaeon]
MKSTSRLLSILLLAIMLAGVAYIQPLAMTTNDGSRAFRQEDSNHFITGGFDSQNISISLVSPTNRSGTSGTLDITIDITSDFGNLNVTLFIEDAIYSTYNKTLIGTGNQVLSVDTTLASIPEGNLNFTILLEYKDATWDEKESFYLEYFVDNDSVNFEVSLTSPANETILTGTANLLLNITSDFAFVNFTLFIDGETYPTYDGVTIVGEPQAIQIDTTAVREGLLNFTLLFDYDVVDVQETHELYLVFIVDNDGQPITLSLISPTNQSQVSDAFNLTVELGSDYGGANLTVFVEGEIEYPQFNLTYIANGEHDLELNTTILAEGALNFTLLLEYNVTGENARIAYLYIFSVNNHGEPAVVFLTPDAGEDFIGLDEFTLNITSDYEFVYLTITVDDEITPEYNHTLVASGVGIYTINGSRYENGDQTVVAIVETEEGLQSTTSRVYNFLDYVRIQIRDLTAYDRISGNASITIRIQSPYSNVTLSAYVDGFLAPDVVNITLQTGIASFNINTVGYSEGEHNFTFKAYAIGEFAFTYKIILEVDNHGAPSVSFVSPLNDVVVGVTTFTVEIDSTWDIVNLTVFVDDEVVTALEGLSVDVGEVTFELDTNLYSKWEHVVKVLVVTDEGLEGFDEELYGFANFKLEEIVSGIIILVIALGFPLRRWRSGGSIRAVLIADLLFAVVVAGVFFALGVNSIPFAIWHINMASIWALGAALIFTNIAVPLAIESEE